MPERTVKRGRHYFWSGVEVFGAQGANLAFQIIFVRNLDPRSFGVFAAGFAIVSGLQLFAMQGLGDSLIQERYRGSQHAKSLVFQINIAVALVLMFGISAFAGELASFFSMEGLDRALVWLSFLLPLNALAVVQDAELRAAMKFNLLAVRRLSGVVLGGVAGVVAIVLGFGGMALVVQSLATVLVSTGLLWILGSWRPSFCMPERADWALIKFGMSRCGSGIMMFVNRRTDDLLISKFLGATAMGYYDIAYKILRAITAATFSVVSRVLYPKIATSQATQQERKSSFRETFVYLTVCSAGIFGALMGYSPQIIELLYGERWLAAATPASYLAIAGGFQTPILALHIYLRGIGRADGEFLSISSYTGVVAVILYLASRDSIEMVALAIAVCSVVWLIVLAGVLDLKEILRFRESMTVVLAQIAVVGVSVALGRGLWGRLTGAQVAEVPALFLSSIVYVTIFIGMNFFIQAARNWWKGSHFRGIAQ